MMGFPIFGLDKQKIGNYLVIFGTIMWQKLILVFSELD